MSIQIIHTDQDIFQLPVQAIVNPVNLVGVMGKGLALQFKERYPEVFDLYKEAIADRTLVYGRIHVVNLYDDPFFQHGKPDKIINFPTKQHWREPSTYDLISRGLQALTSCVQQMKIYSIAIPPLGCGLGGLDRNEVEAMINQEFLERVGKYLNVCYLVRF